MYILVWIKEDSVIKFSYGKVGGFSFFKRIV